MQSINFDDVWNLLSANNFDINDDIDSSVVCMKCGQIMVDPYVTSCSCRFCRHCIVDHLRSHGRICPGGKPDCGDIILEMDVNVGKDIVARRKIMQMSIKCPNKFCSFRTRLEIMDQHFRKCTMQMVKCPFEPYGCTSFDGRQFRVVDHLHSELLEHSELMLDTIRNIRNDQDEHMRSLKQKDQEILEVKDDVTKYKRKIDDLSKEEQNTKVLLLELKSEIQEMKVTMTKIDENKQKINVDKFFPDKEVPSPRMETIQDNKLNPSQSKESSEYEWMFVNFVEDGRNYSDPFYLDKYRLRLSLYAFNGEFMQLSVCIMLGDKDGIANWPMKHTIILSIINQSTGKVYKCWRINRENYKYQSAFNRPQFIENNIECEGIYLDSHPELLKSNSLTVRCSLGQ